MVEIKSRVIHPQAFGDLVVANKNGAPIFLRQVARIEDSQAEMESSAFLNGKTAVAIDILRSSDSNVIEVTDNTRKTLEEIKAQLPKGTTAEIVVDSSKGIRGALKTLPALLSKALF